MPVIVPPCHCHSPYGGTYLNHPSCPIPMPVSCYLLMMTDIVLQPNSLSLFSISDSCDEVMGEALFYLLSSLSMGEDVMPTSLSLPIIIIYYYSSLCMYLALHLETCPIMYGN